MKIILFLMFTLLLINSKCFPNVFSVAVTYGNLVFGISETTVMSIFVLLSLAVSFSLAFSTFGSLLK